MLKIESPTRSASDEGSVVVAVMVIMILVALSAGILTSVVGNGEIVLGRQNTSAALAAADAGVADALFMIDQQPSVNKFCVSPTVSGCVAQSVPALASDPSTSVSYQAKQLSQTEWQIDSVGTVHGTQAAVQELLVRSAAYPYAMFGNTGLTFNGTSTYGFGTFTAGGVSVDSPAGNVSIGSNGTIACNGGLGSNVTPFYYSGGGAVSGSCGGTPQPIPTSDNLPIPQAPAGATSCPYNGNLGATAGVASLSAGTYLCTTPVTINGDLAVQGGAVSLYIILDPSTYGASTPALTITPGSNVNFNPSDPLPDATQFIVYSNSTGTFGNSDGSGYTFAGILNAPNASLTADGCRSTYYGALVINTLTCNGSPHLQVYYQNSLNQFYGSWAVTGFTQVPPATVVIG